MNPQLQSVKVIRFKGIKEAIFDVSNINVFIGANNSGKSTLAQVIHFCVGLTQSIGLAKRWGNKNDVTLSLSPTQLLYSPCVDLYALGHGGKLIEKEDEAIEVSMNLNDGNCIEVTVKKGRNGNINVTVKNLNAAKTLSSLESPFTIYSPGLAGISKAEEFISNGVLLRTIARGDANLVFRNILLRLHELEKRDQWSNFLLDLQKLFQNIQVEVSFENKTDEHIMVFANTGGGKIPIELAGTGILQAVQILAYVHYFHPSIIILDEPDSHLHPNNQRLLCKLLQTVAEDRGTQVFLTTHSRHVVDALSGQASFLWVRNGEVEEMEKDHDLAVLLDIGALDVKEMLSNSRAKCIVLTEDALKQGLEIILDASNIDDKDRLVLAYYGCTAPHNLRPLLELIRGSNSSALIVVHRDRDYLSDVEAEKWKTEIRNMQAEPFLTSGVDIESHYLNSKHLSKLNDESEGDISSLIEKATTESLNESVAKYVNGRIDIEKRAGTYGKLDVGKLAADALLDIKNDIEKLRHSKSVLKTLRKLFQEKYKRNLKVFEISEHLLDSDLFMISKKVKPKHNKTCEV